MAKRASTKKKGEIKATDNSDETSINQDQATGKDSSASNRRKEKLKQDGEFIELPEVNDIPGQENIVSAGVPGAMADTTLSSDDEEGIRDGKDLLAPKEDEEVEIVMGTEADVTAEDLALLGDPNQDMDQGEDEMVRKEGLDDVDNDGDPLNEAASDNDTTGDDLDVPGDDEEQDEMEEDEENKYYSTDDNNDERTEKD
jgi:hypothetical protein